MSCEFTIRPIKPEDAAAFLALDAQLCLESPFMLRTADEVLSTSVECQRALISSMDNGAIWVVEKCGNTTEKHSKMGGLVAYLGLSRGFCGALYGKVEMAMGVLELHQRQGIASELLKTADRWMNENHGVRLELHVHTSNAKALSLYKKHGFEVDGTLKAYAVSANGFEDFYVMSRLYTCSA